MQELQGGSLIDDSDSALNSTVTVAKVVAVTTLTTGAFSFPSGTATTVETVETRCASTVTNGEHGCDSGKGARLGAGRKRK